MFRKDLGKSVDRLASALHAGDNKEYWSALEDIPSATRKARPAEVQAALEKLVPILERISFGVGADLAPLTGSMADCATDPAAVVPTLVRRAIDVMETAVRFEEVHRSAYGKTPFPEDDSQIRPTMQRFTSDAGRHGMTEAEATVLVEAWFSANAWVQPVLFLAQRKDVRAMLPDRDRLTAAVEAVPEQIDTASWLRGLLLVLDDEPLIVLHRASSAGFRVTISGIGDNFQLHTLLAATLLGTHLPGERPGRAEIAAATDGDPVPPGGLRGYFNLVDAEGEWIWNEGRPADIPRLDGTRVVVIDPAPYSRTWNAGRAYPLMRPNLTVDGVLPAAEAARWLSRIKPGSASPGSAGG